MGGEEERARALATAAKGTSHLRGLRLAFSSRSSTTSAGRAHLSSTTERKKVETTSYGSCSSLFLELQPRGRGCPSRASLLLSGSTAETTRSSESSSHGGEKRQLA